MEPWLSLGTALVLTVLGAWVAGARPRATENQALGLLLVLFAGSNLAFLAYRSTQNPERSRDLLRLIYALELPALLLVGLAFERLFLDRPRSRRRRRGLWAMTGTVVALLVTLLAWTDPWFVSPLVGLGLPARLSVTLGDVYGATLYGVMGLATFAGGIVAADSSREPVKRRQGAALGTAFAALAGHSGATELVHLAAGDLSVTLGEVLVQACAALALVALAVSLPRLVQPFEATGRRLATSAALAPFVAGLVDASRDSVLPALGLAIPFEYRSTRPLWWVVFATAVSLAVVRYGLAGFRRGSRRRVACLGTLATVLVSAGVGLWAIPAAGLDGVSQAGTSAALLVLLAGAWIPLESLQRAGLDWLTPDPADPDVRRARHEAYQAALSASTRDDHPPDSQDSLLEHLRRELQLSEEDHRLLAAELDRSLPRETSEPLMGRYTIETPLTSGRGSKTYRAREVTTGRRVVVKRVRAPGEGRGLDPNLLDRWRRIDHERVRALERSEPVDHGWVLVLDHVHGETVSQRLTERDRFPPDEATRIGIAVLEGLEVLHEAGIAHGDLKPENVLVHPDRGPVLVDLGSAVVTQRPPDETRPVRVTGGSLAAMAPEQVDGQPPTVASDVYAAGALVHRLFTGEHYLDFGPESSQNRRAIRRKPPDLDDSHLPEPVADVLARALAKEPGDRYGSAVEMARALQSAVLEPGDDDGGRRRLRDPQHEP